MTAYEYELARRAKKDSKLIYSYINSKREIKEDIRTLKDDYDMIKKNRGKIVSILNTQFGSVFVEDN